jgi:hypothetical protein
MTLVLVVIATDIAERMATVPTYRSARCSSETVAGNIAASKRGVKAESSTRHKHT